MLLFEIFILEGKTLVFKVQALHLRLELSQSLLQDGRVIRVKVGISLPTWLREAWIRKHVVGARRCLMLLVVHELEVAVGKTARVVWVFIEYIS